MAARIEFDWDPNNARSNRAKHDVASEEAMRVFADPLALSVLDIHSDPAEERWVTLGMSAPSRLLVVVHTHVKIDGDTVYVRLISARRATRREQRDYENAG